MFKIVDRYLLKQFILTFFFAIIALSLIFVLVDLMENLGDFIDQNTKFIIILKYYIYYLPTIIQLMLPVGSLLATLFTVGRLSTTNEITAMKSSGFSLYRIMVPFIFMGLLLSFSHLYFNGWIVPKAAIAKKVIEEKNLKRISSGNQIFNIYFRDTPLRNVTMHFYDAPTKTGNSVTIEEYSNEKHPRLINKIECKKMVWNDTKKLWVMSSVIQRDFTTGMAITKTMDSSYLKLSLTHSQIEELKKSISEMDYNELQNYIKTMSQGGKDTRQMLIEYYGNYAFPFANLIVILFGVPFASIKKKGGIAIQIGAAMVVSFFYIIFTKVGQTIGFYSNFNPIITGWLANIIFFIASLFVMFKTRT